MDQEQGYGDAVRDRTEWRRRRSKEDGGLMGEMGIEAQRKRYLLALALTGISISI